MFLEERYCDKVFPVGQYSVSHANFVKFFSSSKNSFDLYKLNKVTSLSQPLNWFFSPVKVDFVFKQYLMKPYKLECFTIEMVNMSDDDEKSYISLDGDFQEQGSFIS